MPSSSYIHGHSHIGLIAYKSIPFPVRGFSVLKNATPERFEFRFNPLNRNVFVNRKPNLLLSCDNQTS